MKRVAVHLLIAVLTFLAGIVLVPTPPDRFYSTLADASEIAIPAKVNQWPEVKPAGREQTANKIDCSKRNAYDFVEDEDLEAIYANVVQDGEVLSRIVFRKGPKNFLLNSIVKTPVGLDIKADWGSGVDHYEIQFSFMCAKNNFYLHRVNKINFSTADPESGNFTVR